VDDSIVRGNTTKAIVRMLREAGAREVHVRITSPPVRWPCFYGIDMPTRAELVASDLPTRLAHHRDVRPDRLQGSRGLGDARASLSDEVAAYLGADSLGYLSLEALTEAAAGGPKGLCTACFTGDYPIPVEGHAQGKALLEGVATPR